MSANWDKEKELSNVFWLRLITKLALKLPRWSTRTLLHPIVFFFVLIAPNKRRASRHYLKQVLSTTPRIWHIYKHFFWFASALLDRVYFLSNRHEVFEISYINREMVIETFEKNPGQFFLSGHIGSVEALRTQVSNLQYKIKPVIKLEQNQTIVTLLEEISPGFYNDIIPFEGLATTFNIYEHLKKGVSVALLADRVIGDSQKVKVNFLGEQVYFSEGIFEMILRFPYPTNLFFCLYLGGNRYQVEYLKFDVKSSDTPTELAQKFADQLEQQCLKSPYNWFNFYTYWVEKDNENV